MVGLVLEAVALRRTTGRVQIGRIAVDQLRAQERERGLEGMGAVVHQLHRVVAAKGLKRPLVAVDPDRAHRRRLALHQRPAPKRLRRIGVGDVGFVRNHDLGRNVQTSQGRWKKRTWRLIPHRMNSAPDTCLLVPGASVGIRGHDVGGEEPGLQRKMGAVQHGARGYRSLAPAIRAFPTAPVPLELPAFRPAAGRADEAVAPTKLHEMAGAGVLVRKELLELLERHRTVMLVPAGHDANIRRTLRQVNPSETRRRPTCGKGTSL